MEDVGNNADIRLEKFVDHIGSALSNDAQRQSFAAYAVGLLSEGERKSMEPIAARVCPDVVRVDAMHQRIQHFLANAAWSDREVRYRCSSYAIEEMLKHGPMRSWIIDDTGLLKQGTHSVGVQRQYTGSAGKIANCQIAVSLSVATSNEHVPIEMELYLPESWTASRARRKKAKIPREVKFRTKTKIAIEMIERAVDTGVPHGVVLADAFYGRAADFRNRVRELGLEFIVAVDSDSFIWPVVDGKIHRRKRQRADAFAEGLVHRQMTWRDGTRRRLSGKFGFGLIRIDRDAETLIFVSERRSNEKPKFYLAALDEERSEKEIVQLLKERWRTERIYEDLKGELGFDHFEGRTYPGWHHHVSVVLCCFAFLAAERARAFSPCASWSFGNDSFKATARASLSRFLDHDPAEPGAANYSLAAALPNMPRSKSPSAEDFLDSSERSIACIGGASVIQ
jgi:SRSO17 transposase